MHRHGSLSRKTMWVAALAMVFQPQMLMAANSVAPTLPKKAAKQISKVTDVALGASGKLTGQAVDSSGKPLAQTKLTIANGRVQLHTITDAQGAFQVTGLQGGVYRVEAGRQVQLCRVWMPGTAPPSATAGLLFVQDSDLALGQSCNCGTGVSCGSPVCGGGGSRVKSLLSNPLVFGGLVAAAIAIPVAIHNSDDDDPPTSP